MRTTNKSTKGTKIIIGIHNTSNGSVIPGMVMILGSTAVHMPQMMRGTPNTTPIRMPYHMRNFSRKFRDFEVILNLAGTYF